MYLPEPGSTDGQGADSWEHSPIVPSPGNSPLVVVYEPRCLSLTNCGFESPGISFHHPTPLCNPDHWENPPLQHFQYGLGNTGLSAIIVKTAVFSVDL